MEFPQAKGRTVEKVELSLDSDFHCVSIRFKDNTDLTVVIDAGLTFQAQYSEVEGRKPEGSQAMACGSQRRDVRS